MSGIILNVALIIVAVVFAAAALLATYGIVRGPGILGHRGRAQGRSYRNPPALVAAPLGATAMRAATWISGWRGRAGGRTPTDVQKQTRL